MTRSALPNYGDRDQAVRCQTYSPVRKLDGLPHELFALYWRDVHGPLCARLPGLGFYVQHHFSREHRDNLWPRIEGVRDIVATLDGAVEIGFASDGDQARFVEASPILFGDEINVFGWDAAFNLPNGSKTFVDRQRDGAPNGPDQLHRLHVYLHGKKHDDAFRGWLSAMSAELAADDLVQKLRLHIPQPFDNANPQPPSPVDHYVADDMRELAVMEIGFESPLHAQRLYQSTAFGDIKRAMAGHVEAMAAFLVTGVYTYVRDGKLTVAGLRGSRTAEIIVKTGALNHLDEDVTRMFLRS